MGHVSAPYNSVDNTKASYNLIFVNMLSSLSLHIFVNLPKTPLALPSLPHSVRGGTLCGKVSRMSLERRQKILGKTHK